MNNETVLKKAIRKAIGNGWKVKIKDLLESMTDKGKLTEDSMNDVINFVLREDPKFYFDHNFAKAFWGELDKWYTTACTCGGVDFHLGGYDMHYPKCAKIKADRGYKFHLGKMVLESEPIKYLEKFL